MMMKIHDRLDAVHENIALACQRAGRASGEVTLIGVSKTHPAEAVRQAHEAGLRDFGENRVQEWRDKAPSCPDGIFWHMIGQCQSNKVKYIVPQISLIHSLDRLSLAVAIEEAGKRFGRPVCALVQINLGQGDARGGIAPEQVSEFLERLAYFRFVHVVGLMVLPPPNQAPQALAQHLARGYDLFSKARVTHRDIEILSMGMSDDYALAIEHGATHVRVGSAIFGDR